MPGGDLFYYDSNADTDSGMKTGSACGSNPGGKPMLVLIHGLGDEADTWRHAFPLLVAAGYRVVAPDLPGFGRSQWKGRIGLGVHCKAVMRLMSVAGANAECPAVLVGSSLGAGIAELIAGRHPGLVKGIVLIAGCFPFAKSANKKFLLLGLPFLGRKWYRGFRKNHDAARRSLHFYYADLNAMDDADRDFLCERVIARVESTNQERGYLSTARSMNKLLVFGSWSVTRKIKAFPGKVFVLCGEKDRVFPPEKTGLFRTLRPDAGFAVVTGAGHLPHQESPGACVMEILRFLEEGR